VIRVTIPLDGPDPDFARGCYAADEFEGDAVVDLATETVTWTGGRVWRAGAVEAERLTVEQLEFEVGALAGWNVDALDQAESQGAPEAPSGVFQVVPVSTRALDARARRLGRTA
jgi:hypothetical protein